MSSPKRLIQEYTPEFKEEAETRKKMLVALENDKNPFSRDSFPHHFTASSLLLNTDETKFLLLHHTKLGKWLQPGGHCDGDANLLNVAIKEAKEESGIKDIIAVSNQVLDLDIHYIPNTDKEPAHWHYDVRFILKTEFSNNFTRNHESNDMKWVEFENVNFKELELGYSISKLVNKYIKLANSSS